MNQEFLTQIKHQFKTRIHDENMVRIWKCLDLLDEAQVWHQFNKNTNSIGHLILHLEGNATQWILSTLGSEDDHRNRDAEFNTPDKISKSELKTRLRSLYEKMEGVVKALHFKHLLEEKSVQCYQETGISILIHVIEHFSYHTGQIALITKLILDVDTGFYAGLDLNKTK